MTPYPGAAGNVPPALPFPASIADGATYDTGVITSHGANVSVWVQASTALTMHIIQYADAAGSIVVQDTSQAVSANTLTNKSIADGKLFGWFKVTLANASGGPSALSKAAILQ